MNGIRHEIPFVQEMMEVTRNMWQKGWDERNGGNISYLLPGTEVKKYMDVSDVKQTLPLPCPVQELAEKYFIVTGTGKYFKNVFANPEENLGVIRIGEDGRTFDIIWGLKNDGRPTSELAAHFMSHTERLKKDPNHRVIIHNHATHVLAMTFVHGLEEKAFTKTLWEMCTECLVVFPDGVGVLPWLVPGTNEIGRATADKMKDCRIVIWPQHGILGAGITMDEAFGLIETVEKAAEIYMLIHAHQGGIKQSITDRQLLALAKAFGVRPRAGVLQA
ncbi:rhamnulose-1-phosphate aldolase [Lucifera butyrica]|uniref:Rhamnulose-1-phosphate aldolase n=1 Tax=Lucifera butyrica TaxID=1351585 RepID=A0A498R8J6_9FIRM|nr:rhamnulose-1-phosphate aldolase [Lucifera butyrica]VBB06602.1 rhamnulose-1-phosphate aldolase [Lucifera butyrica]